MLTLRTTTKPRPGFIMTEVVVAAVVLVAAISVLTQLAVRVNRLQIDTRHQQIALEELSNQLEKLVLVTEEDLPQELGKLLPTDFAQRALPSPQIHGELLDDEDGRRVLLQLNWRRRGDPPPVTLAGWLDHAPPASEELR